MKWNKPGLARWSALAAAVALATPLLMRAEDKKADSAPQKPASHKPSPLSADESLATFAVAPGLKATVWATEPGVVKPCDMDIDSRGRIWVNEGANYRSSHPRAEGDRILILEDTKHTGVCDSYKVFVQDKELSTPLGICVLGNKVIVSQSPNMLIYTIDETGDKPVGPPQKIFTGFSGISHDHGLHAGVFGPDGRFYFNCGNEGSGNAYVKFGDAISQHDGKPVVDITGSEIGGKSQKYHGHDRQKGEGWRQGLAMSMNLDGSDFEVLGFNFRNNYELAVDSYGNVWQSDNDDDGNQGVRINYIMEGGNFGYTGPTGSSWKRDQDQYKKAFPGQTKQEAQWHQQWPGVVPNLLNTGAGSPCGITVYEGDLLPHIFYGALLHADAGPNVVRAYVTRPGSGRPTEIMKPVTMDEAVAFKKGAKKNAGAGFEAVTVNLVKGDDHWFRPDDVCVAPDGAVYFTDWYDPGVGGHATGDTGTGKHGNDWHLLHGRVYRLTPENYTPPTAAPKLDLDSVEGQIAALNSPNLATRYLGYTKLADGLDKAPVIAALAKQLENGATTRLKARALWLLARSKDGATFIKKALHDPHDAIRVTAVRAARRIGLDVTQFADELLADPSPFVWRELALAVQFDASDKVLPLIVKLADKYDGADRWYLEAFGIAANGREKAVLDAWEKGHENKDPKNNEGIVWRLKLEPVQLGNEATTQPAPGPHASAEGGALPFAHDNGRAARDADTGVESVLAVVDSNAADEGVSRQNDSGLSAFSHSTSAVVLADASTPGQAARANVVGAQPSTPRRPGSAGGIAYLGRRGSNVVSQSTSMRAACPGVEAIAETTTTPLSNDEAISCRVTIIDRQAKNASAHGRRSNFCAPAESSSAGGAAAPASQPAMKVVEKELKTRDGKILPPMDDLARLTGDPKAGALVARDTKAANCLKCHQIGDEGESIGPGLTVIGGKLNKAQLYEAILYPSAAIEMGFESWIVKTKDGDVFTGIKTEDTPDHITIKDTDAKYHDIDRDKIARLVKQDISLMPEGLNEAMTQQQLVDLVEYLSRLKE